MGLIPAEIITQIIDRTDIVETIASYIPLKRAGQNFKAVCPFHHEKTPSFIVNPDKQIFHCFGCGAGGNVLTFVMKHDRLEFPEAVRLLAQRVNVEIPETQAGDSKTASERLAIFKVNELAVSYFHKNLLSDRSQKAKEARDYLKRRDVSLGSVKQFYLGYALDEWDGLINFLLEKKIPLSLMEKAGLIIAKESGGYYDRFRNRIIFPIFDSRYHCRAFGARSLEKSPSAKYLNSPETFIYTKGQHLYGFHLAKEAILEQDYVVIVEGYLDCLMPFQSGFCNIVASLGTALTLEQIRLLRRYSQNVVMLFDMDPAGQSAMLRSLDMLIEEGINVKMATLEEGEDPDTYVRKFGLEAFRDRVLKSQSLFDYKVSALLKIHDISSLEGKAKLSGEILPTINKFENAIVRGGYLNRLSKILKIPEETLALELNKLGTDTDVQKRLASSTKIRTAIADTQAKSVELDILKLLLENSNYIQVTKQEISPNDFQDETVRRIIEKVYELFDEQRQVTVGGLLNYFEDPKVHHLISGLLAKEEPVTGDRNKMHRDYINRLRTNRLKLQTRELLEQIHEAESNGDHNRLDILKREFNQLIKK